MDKPLSIAIDLGAGSGRVFLGSIARDEFFIEEVHRFSYPPSVTDGHLRWNFEHIFFEICAGLRDASAKASSLSRPVATIGVDSWGVDFGLIDSQGRLIDDPVCYRDSRTNGMMEQVFQRIPRLDLFSRTGVQFLQFNTIFQLAALEQSGIPPMAERLLMIPDLVNNKLTGTAVTEFTNSTTTQLINAKTRRWDVEILERVGIPASLMPEIVPAGHDLGVLRSELGNSLGLGETRVIAPGTHDTASAVAGAPLKKGCAYISSGTWSLVGVELRDTLINDAVAEENFTNEGGVFGTNRFLKNVMGLWILEMCRKEWLSLGHDVAHETLIKLASDSRPETLIYPDDPRFLNPPSMIEAISDQVRETAQKVPDSPAEMTACILNSLALRYAWVLRTIERLTSQAIEGIQIVGGGSRNEYLNQATSTASGKPVAAGPIEATVIGNLVAQSVAMREFDTLDQARESVAARIELRQYAPRPSPEWLSAREKYDDIQARLAG